MVKKSLVFGFVFLHTCLAMENSQEQIHSKNINATNEPAKIVFVPFKSINPEWYRHANEVKRRLFQMAMQEELVQTNLSEISKTHCVVHETL